MRKILTILLMLGIIGTSIVSAAEKAALESATGSGTRTEAFHATFVPGAERVSQVLGPDSAWPVLVAATKPVRYPGWARREGKEGFLIAMLEVLEDGSVGRWEIVQSTGEASLDQAAAKAFVTWRFQPAMRHNRPVRSSIRVPIRFELTKA